MFDIKIGLSSHEKEFLDESDTITGVTDVLSLFTPEFMKQYTRFESLQEFVAAAGKDFSSQETWNQIQNGGIDTFINENSDFESWEDMYATAGNQFLRKYLT